MSQTAFNLVKNVAEYFTPLLAESQFADRGVLTAEEFVSAGDQLVFACPTWQWSIAKIGYEKAYLPNNKQFLITRNVPSLVRANQYALKDETEETVEEEWLNTHTNRGHENDAKRLKNAEPLEIIDLTNKATTHLAISAHDGKSSSNTLQTSNKTISSSSNTSATATVTNPNVHTSTSSSSTDENDDDIVDIDEAMKPKNEKSVEAEDEIPDMESFQSTGETLLLKPPVEEDDIAAAKPNTTAKSTSSSAFSSSSSSSSSSSKSKSGPSSSSSSSSSSDHPMPLSKSGQYLKAEEPDDPIIRTRRYDLSIVYDKYYRTPRVYLFGYDENHQPLSADQMMEDISHDHANKTVTMETHPFLGTVHASIHPCRHASVMKKLVDQLEERNLQLEKEQKNELTKVKIDIKQYMFLFLKFISSVIPTIEYDFTLKIE